MHENLEELNEICDFINTNFDNKDPKKLYRPGIYKDHPDYLTIVAMKLLQLNNHIRHVSLYQSIAIVPEVQKHVKEWLTQQNLENLDEASPFPLINHINPWLYNHEIMIKEQFKTKSLELSGMDYLVVHEKYGKIGFDESEKKFFRARLDEPFIRFANDIVLLICIEDPQPLLQSLLFKIPIEDFDIVDRMQEAFPNFAKIQKLNLLKLCTDRFNLIINEQQLDQIVNMQESLDLTLMQSVDLIRSHSLNFNTEAAIIDLPII